jgi:hypothetical protein
LLQLPLCVLQAGPAQQAEHVPAARLLWLLLLFFIAVLLLYTRPGCCCCTHLLLLCGPCLLLGLRGVRCATPLLLLWQCEGLLRARLRVRLLQQLLVLLQPTEAAAPALPQSKVLRGSLRAALMLLQPLLLHAAVCLGCLHHCLVKHQRRLQNALGSRRAADEADEGWYN